ncbi:MAG: Bug family tripartite tricarboxylate transporter substrate binding protein [Burkholderiales bacterium]
MRFVSIITWICAASIVSPVAIAQTAATFPSKPLRMVVGYTPGGATDVLARLTAQHLGARLSQNVVVENRPGATGVIGLETVMRAPPDGYTLLFISSAEFVVLPALRSKLPFDSLRDFTSLALMASIPSTMAVHPDFPAKTVQELVTLARAKPESVRWGSSGIGGGLHLQGEYFWRSANARATHIPYKGGGDLVAAVLGRQIELTFIGVGTVAKQVLGGQLRALAVTSETRASSLPTVPTLMESGFPEYRYSSWWGVVGPPAMPERLTERLAADLQAAGTTPDFRARLTDMGGTGEPISGKPFREFVVRDLERMRQLVTSIGIKLED